MNLVEWTDNIIIKNNEGGLIGGLITLDSKDYKKSNYKPNILNGEKYNK